MVAMIAILVLVLILVVMIACMSKPSQPRLLVGQSPRDHAAEADIEDHDIDEMIEARNEIRRRLGKPEIGDELEESLRRSPETQKPPWNV
jgi:hypothetical protein